MAEACRPSRYRVSGSTRACRKAALSRSPEMAESADTACAVEVLLPCRYTAMRASSCFVGA